MMTALRKASVIAGFATLLCLGPSALAGPPISVEWIRDVEAAGFSIDTETGLSELLGSDNHGAQCSAVLALAQTRGVEAVDDLRKFLRVPSLRVRAKAAGALADLGDRSGLERMRGDFNRYIPPKLKRNDVQVFTRLRVEKVDPLDVLEVAIALGKLGDPRAGKFAETTAMHAPLAAYRYRAVRALGALMVNANEAELSANQLNPGRVLEEIARSEPEITVRWFIADQVLDPEVKLELALRVFDALRESPHASDREARVITRLEQKKRAQIQPTTQPVTPSAQPAPDLGDEQSLPPR